MTKLLPNHRAGLKAANDNKPLWEIACDLPPEPVITEAELEIVETYLGAMVADMLKPCAANDNEPEE